MIARTLIIVSDGAHCRMFEHKGGEHRLSHVASLDGDHRPSRKIDADRGGSVFDSVGSARHRYESKISAHEHLKDHFISRVVTEAEKQHNEAYYNGVVVAAPPHTLGKLRQKLPRSLQRVVRAEIRKDLTHISSDDIFEEMHGVLLPLEDMKKCLILK